MALRYPGMEKRALFGDNELRIIRSPEIAQIRELMGEGFNQAQIARILNLNDSSVRLIYNKIIDGQPLKFDDEKYKSFFSGLGPKEERVKHWSITKTN